MHQEITTRAKLLTPSTPTLPTDRTFVVELGVEADLEHHRCEGRVEHVGSGRDARFHSLEELVVFMQRMLHHGKEAQS
jgi:hypothetical protein